MPFQAWILEFFGYLSMRKAGFNGAMPFQAWIRSCRLQSLTHTPWLQWGHALSGMDTPKLDFSPPSRDMLQWGHALSGMDTRFGSSRRLDRRFASMGPCPFRHGYNDLNPFLIADRIASMGPCPFRHGYNSLPPRPRSSPRCFNGAMPFQAWIPPSTRRPCESG